MINAKDAVDAETRRTVRGARRAVIVGIAAAVLVTGGALGMSGCGEKFNEPFKDGPHNREHLRPMWTLIEAPDGFSNQATACLVDLDGAKTGVRIFSAYHGDSAYGAISSVPDPKNC